jgi:hypothetical protein
VTRRGEERLATVGIVCASRCWIRAERWSQLADQLGDVVRERDPFCHSLLLCAHVAQLGFEGSHVGIALR